MATLRIPADLMDRLRATTRTGSRDRGYLTADECEYLALHLEWLAAEVREKLVRESSWSRDRDVDHEEAFPFAPYTMPVLGPWKHTVEIQFASTADDDAADWERLPVLDHDHGDLDAGGNCRDSECGYNSDIERWGRQ